MLGIHGHPGVQGMAGSFLPPWPWGWDGDGCVAERVPREGVKGCAARREAATMAGGHGGRPTPRGHPSRANMPQVAWPPSAGLPTTPSPSGVCGGSV